MTKVLKDINSIIQEAENAMQGYPSNSSVALCLTYNVGDLNKAVYRIAYCQFGDRNPKPYYKLAKAAIADAVLQARILAHRLDFVWDEVITEGEKRHSQAMKEVREGKRV